MANDLVEIYGERLRLHFHPGQLRAWDSVKRWVVVLAGTQGGKTSFGPHWLYREISRKGPGDYLVVTPTFPLLQLKALPEFRRLFEDWLEVGKYYQTPVKRFEFDEAGQQKTFGAHGKDYRTTVFFGYAADPDSLESATAKAAWLDEAGQKKFKIGAWQAIQRRLSIHQGRALITTTPYGLGWLKSEFWDRQKSDPDVEVIRFDSTENPSFPKEEFERAKTVLPLWKFNLFYRAIFTKPAGLIYDCFEEKQIVPDFAIPNDWRRYLGLDFGGVNTAGLFYANEPHTENYYLYREYKAGGRTAEDHAKALLKGEPMIPTCVGGSKSEGQWRREFQQGGLPVRSPSISDVEVGIDRVYGAHKRNKIYVFESCKGYLDEKMSYSRELDENDEPTEEIENKNDYHFMDSERYIFGFLLHTGSEITAKASISNYIRGDK